MNRLEPGRILPSVLLAALLLGAAVHNTSAATVRTDDAKTMAGPEILAVRYATIRGFPVSSLVIGAPRDERMDIAMVVWVIRDDDRVILFDSGFHRAEWMARFDIVDFMRPDSAVRLAGVRPEDVTDIIVSHAHWDHMGGIDLFPAATVHIQREEYMYYTETAWQDGGRNGGIDRADIDELIRRNEAGLVHMVEGDDAPVLPGIRAFTGARHTFASQYVRIDGDLPFVLASDNCYTYRNLETGSPGATFEPGDRDGNVAAQHRMVQLAGSAERVIPGHDPLQFERFPTAGRVARIRGN